MIARKIYAYCLTIGGGILAYRSLIRLSQEGFIVGSIIAVLFYLLYLLPFVVFGATIEPKESGIRVRQYVDVEIPYSEVRACYGYLLPPFYVVMLITARRFPLCLLLSGQGALSRHNDLEEKVRRRIGGTANGQAGE